MNGWMPACIDGLTFVVLLDDVVVESVVKALMIRSRGGIYTFREFVYGEC